MSHFGCIVQEASPAEQRQVALEARLKAHAAEHGVGEATVSWTVAADGYMFTEAKPSTSSIIACLIPGPTTLDQRESFMRGVCDLWSAETGCTDHEIVVSITETGPEA
ncbi:MAG: hypothetical protein AAGC53_01475 [Actinomycetota bacterium]